MINIAVILLSVVFTASSPASAQRGEPRSISASDRQQGESAHPQLVKEFGGAYTGRQAAFVSRVGKRVAVQSGLSNAGSDFTVTTLDSPVENAFAIPGGYIYITRQLLALMNSEAELASVLGHEVGHVAARHAASRNTRSTIGQIAAAAAGMATGSTLASRAIGAGAQLYTLKYGRDQEYQADALGIRYMTAAGYNPYAAPAILAALDESTALSAQASGRSGANLPSWASSHPNSQERVARAGQLAADTGKPEPSSVQDTAFLRMLDGLPYGPAGEGKVVRIVTVGPRDTIASLAERMAYADLGRERFLILNGLLDDQDLRPGSLMKIIVDRR